MTISSFIKKNKIFTFTFICVIAWIIFLSAIMFSATRVVTFYDTLNQEDISSQYTSTIPLLRYLIEPIIGITFVMGNNYEVLMAFIISVIVFRVIFNILKQRGMIKSEKAKLLWYPVKDIIRFTFIVVALMLPIALLTLLVGWLILGFYFVNLYFMLLIQLFIHIGLILIGIKSAFILVKGFHPHLKYNYHAKKRFQKREIESIAYKVQKIWRRETAYVFGISVAMFAGMLFLVTIPFPTHVINVDLADDEFLFDFHVHTTFSDGYLTPEERVEWYISQGIKGAAFSDHDNLRGATAAKAYVELMGYDFVVIMSEEWTDHQSPYGFHMNIFGLEETLVPLESETPEWFDGPKAMNASDTIQYVKANGGFVSVNHYNERENTEFGGIGKPYNYTQFLSWGIDGFEVSQHEHKLREFCINNSLAVFSASDTHGNEPCDEFMKIKFADPNNLTVESIFAALKTNDTSNIQAVRVYLNPNDFEIVPDFLKDLEFGFVEKFFEYLMNLDGFQVLSWICWSAIGFLFISLVYRKAKNLDIEIVRRKIL